MNFQQTFERTKWKAGGRRRTWILGVIALLLVLFFILFDWNWFKGPVERAVRSATGREFEIEGDLDIDLGFSPTIRMDQVHLGNADWSKTPEMARMERFEFSVSLLPLFRGEVILPRIYTQSPRLLIERHADGRGNWEFPSQKKDETPDETGRTVLVRDLHIDDGKLRVHEPKLQTDLQLDVASGQADSADARAPLIAKGDGRYRGFDFDLDAKIDSPLDLSEAERPYRLDLRARAGGTQARIDGALDSPLQVQDFDLHLALSGANLARLYPLAGVALPETPPYSLDGRIGRNGTVWRYRGMKGKVGDSDIAGDVSVDMAGERPMMRAELKSKLLDIDDLAGVIGGTPQTGEGETASVEQRKEAQAEKSDPRMLPDEPFDLVKLRAMDADVSLQAARIEAPDWPIESLSAHLKLDDGLLRLDPLEVGVASGKVKGSVQLNARDNPIAVETKLTARQLDLGKLVPEAEIMKDAVGRLAANVDLRGRGNSVAQMLGNADGELGAAVGQGQVSNLLIELAGLDIAEALRYFLGKDRQIKLRCAYADFGVKEGLMTSRAFAIDTSDTILYADGTVHLKDEKLALRILPKPKDRSPLSIRSPLLIGGTFKNPSFRPEAGPLILRGAAAAALFAIAPPAALLALLETGPGENAQCGPAGPTPPEVPVPAPAKKN